jgi:hypothetical protein
MAEQQLGAVIRHIRSVAGTPHKDWTDRGLEGQFP